MHGDATAPTTAPTTGPAAVSGRASRTRRDVVEAAMTVWSNDALAPLSAVADAAGVGRTTLHRHFPDRRTLVVAVDAAAWVRFSEATDHARIEEGSGLETLGRLARELVTLGPVLGLIFADHALVDPAAWETDGRRDPFAVVAERGLADGSLDPALPQTWIEAQCWATLFGAWLVRDDEAVRHRAGDLLADTLTRAVAARGPRSAR